MDTNQLVKLSQSLDAARSTLSDCIKARSIVNNAGTHQSEISIRCGNVTVSVTEMDRGYTQSIIRGREMIALGIKKVLNAKIDDAQDKVKRIEAEIKALTAGDKP
ncbi:hypothetical protein [Flavobacterium sp.]|uniref:hypothetical protein n=1 Tax=Flavobacterium sp. TaxID=239 RepID=UPI0037BFEFE7